MSSRALPVLVALALPGALAAAKKPAMTALEVYDKVLKAQKSQAALECLVVREEAAAQGAANRVTGTLKILSGGKALLVIPEPSPQKAVSDGKTIWVEMSDVKQVMVYDAGQLRKGGNFFLDLGASIQFYAEQGLKRLIEPGPGFDPGKVAALELMPLKPDQAGFERMRVWVEKDRWLVTQVELKAGGTATRVRFEGLQVVTKDQAKEGAKLPPKSLFIYSAPKGWQVFDMRGMQ